MSDYTKLISELRGHIREVPLTLLRDAADALEAQQTALDEYAIRLEDMANRIAEMEEDIVYWQTYAAER